MNFTIPSLLPTVGPRTPELFSAVRGTVIRLRNKPFLLWAKIRLSVEEVVDTTMSNLVVALDSDGLLPLPDSAQIQPYVNEAAAAAFKEYRQWYRLDADGYNRENPYDPTPPEDHDNSYFDFLVGTATIDGTPEHGTVDLPVDLAVLSEAELDLLSMLGNGLTYREAAGHLGFVFNPESPSVDARAWVQSRLRTIRRKVCGVDVVSQAGAREWLANHTGVTSL